jgi:acyl-CoA thioesterase
MTTTTDHPFDTDTESSRVGDGRHATTIRERWSALPGTPNGGYLLALCLRALAADAPFPDPLVAAVSFLRPPAAGPAEVRTELARTGRRTATGEARLVQDGEEAVRVVATFGDLREAGGRTLALGSPPELPPPDECIPLFGGGAMPGVRVTEHVEYRMPALPGFAVGRPSGDPTYEMWMRFKGGREPDLLSLAFLVDAAGPTVLEIGELGSSTMQLTVHLRAHPAPGWLLCRAVTRYVIGGYHEEDFEIWDSAGTLVAQSRQLAVLRSAPLGR